MFRLSRVAGILQKIYTAGMVTGSVPNLGRKADYRRECCLALFDISLLNSSQ
jgi:hypothetical protein